VLGFDAAALDATAPLSSLGFDSLMAVQLKNRVQLDLAVEIPLAQLLCGPTVEELTGVLARTLGARAAAPAAAGGARPAEAAFDEGSL
jgi:phthiocerol/phenolphthiocerol synthesis type-I polyketide synthase D